MIVKSSMILALVFIPGPAWADYGFEVNETIPNFKEFRDETVLLNVPRVRSQDTFGICYAVTASTLFDEAYCVDNKIADCSAVEDSKRSAVLDMARYNSEVQEGRNVGKRLNYTEIFEGGDLGKVLSNLLYKVHKVSNEACAPFDQFVANVDDFNEARKLEGEIWDYLRSSYDDYQTRHKGCESCGQGFSVRADEIVQKFNLKTSNVEALKAFSEETYEKFLEKLLIPKDCGKNKEMLRISDSWEIQAFPSDDKLSRKKPDGRYNDTIDEIKRVLTDKKRPIGILFCAEEPFISKKKEDCGKGRVREDKVLGGAHSVVIVGYRKVCNTKGKCYDSVKVQNSWGQGWQDQNGDGWLDARALLDRTLYEKNSLVWLEK